MGNIRSYSILLFCIQCALIVCLTSNSNDSPEVALKYIDAVQKKLNLTRSPNIILVIGNTGCGKSTLVHYVAGDYSKIFAEEPLNENSVDFDVRDELDPDRDRVTLPTESRTLIPIFSTDETHTVWVDTPGFGDTRNETIEIATMFLIKRVIKNVSKLKIVLVVNYDSVTKTKTRDDFDNLLSRATELMKNIKRFKNSVSLVVTKAPSFKIRRGRIAEISENSIKNTTAQFMLDHRSVLQRKEASESKVQLIDALLKGSIPRTNEYFPKISIFWRPDNAGPFNKIKKMIKGRRYIRESVFNHSSYAKVQKDDFGFPLTPLAQIKVRNMVQHIVDSISTRLQNNVDRLTVEIQQQLQSAETPTSRLEIVNVGTKCIKTKEKKRKITVKQLADQLTQLVRVYNVSTDDSTELDLIVRNEEALFMLSSLIEDGKNPKDKNKIRESSNLDYYSFLERIINFLAKNEDEIQKGIVQKAQETKQLISTTLVNFDKQLLKALRKKIESINGSQSRLEVLKSGELVIQSTGKEISLNQRVEQLKNLTRAYEIASINVNALSHIDRYEKILDQLKSLAESELQLPIRDWIATSSEAIDYQLSMYDWYLFLEETYQYFGEYDRQTSYAINPNINETNFDSITKQIRRRADYESTPNRILEMNQIINITSQLPTYEFADQTLTIKGHFIKSSNIRHAISKNRSLLHDLTTVKVFALDTFYVDCDLNLTKTKEVELRIMAPKWNVRENATFYLNGIDGGNYSKRAKEGSAGMHGEPGANGGNFFGWANVLINSDRLSVELNGGRGGDGQDGTGSSDYNVMFKETSFSASNDIRGYFKAHGYNTELIGSRTISETATLHKTIGATREAIQYELMLYPDKCCGPTGSGGKGGNGGAGGTFELIYFRDGSKLPKITQIYGRNGTNGTNGKYCDTKQLQVSVRSEIFADIFNVRSKNEVSEKHHLHYEKCSIERGLSFYPLSTPKPNRLHEPMNVVQSLLEYKSYLLDNMNDPVLNIAQNIFDIINSDPAVNSEYKTKDFAMEGNILEKHFFELNKYIDVLPLYDDLLKRVKHFSVENKANFTKVDQRLLTLTHTMILSRTSLQNSHESHLIINIAKFLDLTVENVNELKELKRINVISEQRDEYKGMILAGIQEATNFIKNDIKPEIEQTISMLNNDLKKSVEETVKLQSKTIHESQAKQENLRTIRRNVITRNVLNIIEPIVGSVFGELAQTAVGVVSNIIQSNLVDPKVKEHKVPKSIERLMPENSQEVCNENDQINEFVCAIDKDRETLKALKRFENEIYSELMPMLNKMNEDLMNVEENLVNKSSVALDVTNWKVEKTLRQVQKKLADALGEFEVGSAINECMIRINEAFKLLIDIYDRIQQCQKDSKLVTYLSDLHTANQQNSDIRNAETKKILNELEINLQTNLVLGQYFRVLGAFKQAIFPYAADYLDEYELTSIDNSTGLITHASKQIESLSKKLREYNDTVINAQDERIHSAYFDRGSGSIGPFYVWSNSEIRSRIKQLFDGKKIYLLADVQKSDTRNAVKFNKIELAFNSENQTINQKFRKILKSFHVSLTHMGNSNYRCSNKFYTIPSRPLNIKYSIAERKQRPADKNVLHSKLEAGSSLLSPYTLWSVQLLHGQFKQLKPFVDLISIELHGIGLYVEENAPICESNLEKYYSAMDNNV